MFRIIALFAIFSLVPSSIAWPQTKQDAYEAAKLRIVEMWYENESGAFREILASQGHSKLQIDSILFKSFEAYAACMARAAQEQAHEQSLPEELLLNALGSELKTNESITVTFVVDLEAYGKKQDSCSNVLFKELGLRDGQ